jgi:ParB family chromosome partitioning protein
MVKPALKPRLASVDELFTTQEERDDAKRERVIDIPLEEIDAFPDHPYQVRIDEDMRELVENISEHGVLTPAIARQKEDGRYELVSGHRRKAASELAGLKSLPVIVRDMDRDAAIVFMVNANMQREHVLPSEKARAYRMKLGFWHQCAGQAHRNTRLRVPLAPSRPGAESRAYHQARKPERRGGHLPLCDRGDV